MRRSSLHSNIKYIITHTIILRQAKFDGFRSLTRVLEVGQLQILEAFHLLLELLKLLLWVGLSSFRLIFAIFFLFPPLLRKRFLLCCDFYCRLHSHCHIFCQNGQLDSCTFVCDSLGRTQTRRVRTHCCQRRLEMRESFGAGIGLVGLGSETRAHQIMDTGPIER